MSREPTVNAEELRRLSEAATPGPWTTWHGDDSYAMNCHGIVTGHCDDEYVDEDGHAQHTVALTLLQQPRYASHAAARWDDDATFIVALVNAYRSNQLQVIERDRLIEAATDLRDAIGRIPREAVVPTDVFEAARRLSSVLRSDSTTGDERG